MHYFKSVAVLILLFSYHLALAASDKAAVTEKEPIYVEYDELIYDQNQGITIFKGEVIVIQGKEMLTADEIHYHKQEGKYYAKGNIALLKEDGSVYFADIINLDKFFYKGRAINFKGRLGKNGLIAASSVEIYSKTRMSLNNVVYSTCKICKDNFIPFIPIWQIRAKEALINKNKESIKYKHARVEALGIPIMYAPYLVTPSPGAKRKSGFLIPRIKWSGDFGYSTEIPYYWNILPNMDATLSPIFNSRKDHVLKGEFRHLINYGEYRLAGSITNTRKITKDGTEVAGKKEPRGHLDMDALFQYDHRDMTAFFGFESKRVYDKSKTYLKKYKLSDEDVLTTDIFVKHFWDDNYVFLDTIYYQGLRPNDSWITTPRIVPWLRAYYTKGLGFNNSSLMVSSDVLHLHRKQGHGYKRLSTTAIYRLPFILPFGQLASVNTSIRGDFYQIHQKPILKDGVPQSANQDKKSSTARAYPEVTLKWSWPFINYMNMGAFVIEPVAEVIVSKDQNLSDKLVNEDSQFFELSALNLFSSNRYLGLDQIETGTRLNYGLRGNFKGDYIKNLGFTLGEVVNMRAHQRYKNSSGLDTKHSDFVSKIHFQPFDNTYIVHKLRLEEADLSIMRNEVYALLNLEKWNLGIDYMEIGKRMLDPTQNIYRKDISAGLFYNFYDKWWVGLHSKQKLGNKIPGVSKRITERIHLNYIGDCLHLFFTVERDHTQLKDLRPSTTYSLNFQIPTF